MPADEKLTNKSAAKKLKSGVRWLTLSAVLAIASVGGWWVYNRSLENSATGVEVRLIAVKTDTLEEPINELGILELGDQRPLKSPKNGMVEKVLVNVGDRINIGDQLIVLRSPDRDTKLLDHQYEMQQKELDLAKQRQTVQDAAADLAAKQEKIQALLIQNRTQLEIELQQNKLNIENEQITLKNQQQSVILARENLATSQQKLQQIINGEFSKAQTELRQKQLDIEKDELKLENLRQKVAEAELDLDEAQEKLQQDEKLYARDFIAENDLQRSRQQVRERAANLRSNQLNLTTAIIDLENNRLNLENLEKKLEEEIATAKSELVEKESTLEKEKLQVKTIEAKLNKLDIDLQKSQQDLIEEVSKARSEVQEAEVNLRDTQLELRNKTIDLEKKQLKRQKLEQEILDSIVTAPISGKVLQIGVASGDVVDRSKDLLILGDPAREIVKLQVSTLNAAKIKPNQLARISLAGPDEEVFTGYVEKISLVADSDGDRGGGGRSGDSGGGTVAATVRLDRPSRSFIPGSRVSVDIILEQRQNAIAVETSAVQNLGSDAFVWVRDDEGKAQKKSVTLGLEDLTNGLVEVTDGLKPGDEVILPPVDSELEEGMLVKEFKPENE